MIRNALTGEPTPVPKTVVQQESDFTAEGAPPPGHISGTEVPEIDVSAAATEPARPSGAGLAMADVSVDDWDCLLAAVSMRLRDAVGEAPKHLLNGAGSSLQASLLECVDILDQLHDVLRRALDGAQPAIVKAPEGAARAASAQP